MRLFIWREFSSNHSARFTVVGIFESAEKAMQAAGELRRITKTIKDWYEKPENSEALDALNYGVQEPSPPEMQFAMQYDVDWGNYSLDWIWFGEDEYGPVKVFEHFVFIEGRESDIGSRPADTLIEKLGGEVLVDGTTLVDDEIGPATETYSQIYVSLKCDAPDEATAQSIRDQVAASRDPSTFRGTVKQDGRVLTFNGPFFHIAYGFPALIAYLQAKGCADIQGELTETQDS